MKKIDARIRYTRRVLKDAFLTLLKQKPVNKITVKEVCELAELNRATFYTHYSDCFALLESIEQDILDAFLSSIKLINSFDMTALISSPSRIWVQIAYLAFMVFVLAEVRFNIEYESSLLYAPSAAVATIFLLSVSVSNLVCSGKMMIGITERPITYAIMLAAGLYSLSKLISFCFIGNNAEK